MSKLGPMAGKRPQGPRVLFVSSEALPFAKTGGLADVSAALPVALTRLGADVRLMLPGYPQALDLLLNKRTVATFHGFPGEGRLIEGNAPDSGMTVYLYDSPALYRRDGTIYQDAEGRDWSDNHLRYSGLCHAAAQVALGIESCLWQPDIVHANDWHTALIPAILASQGRPRPATLFTIHNMAFQGGFPFSVATDLGLPSELLTSEGVEYFGQVSFLKAGIRFSDRITTVSPTYAREILTPQYGCGLDGLLRTRADDLVGILNGVDYNVWDPEMDASLPRQYKADDISGKRACKAFAQEEFGLAPSEAPLMIFVNRLTHQKMADVVLSALPMILATGAQLILHGTGDKNLEGAFEAAARDHAAQFATRIGYDETLARRLNAAADMSLTPSRFEPCGLTTMYAMRYGALPITRHVGGVSDTVIDAECQRADAEGATGFVFAEETPEKMTECVRRASHWFHERDWRGVQRYAMQRDFGWERSAQRYLGLYRELVRSDVEVVAGQPAECELDAELEVA